MRFHGIRYVRAGALRSLTLLARLLRVTLCLLFVAWLPATGMAQEPKKPLGPERKIRVLLFTGAGSREYQFLRTTLFRAVADKRVELCLHNQTGHEEVDADVDRILRGFPDRLGPRDAKRPFMSLSEHDVIVAFDPDLSKLKEEQLTLLKDWIDKHGGGFILVAGPAHTYQLASPALRKELAPIKAILPVVLEDIRLAALGIKHETARPCALNFTREGLKAEFLKLSDDDASVAAGWNGFFWNDKDSKPDPAKPVEPVRGFYKYYPVNKLQPAATVLATFAGPKDSRINDGKDEQPFIVSMRFGRGKTLYIGAGEFWRLRAYRDGCYERLWLNIVKSVAP